MCISLQVHDSIRKEFFYFNEERKSDLHEKEAVRPASRTSSECRLFNFILSRFRVDFALSGQFLGFGFCGREGVK